MLKHFEDFDTNNYELILIITKNTKNIFCKNKLIFLENNILFKLFPLKIFKYDQLIRF